MIATRFIIKGSNLVIISSSKSKNCETAAFLAEEFSKDFPNAPIAIPHIYEIKKGAFNGYIAVQFKIDKVFTSSQLSKEAMSNLVASKYFPINDIGGKFI